MEAHIFLELDEISSLVIDLFIKYLLTFWLEQSTQYSIFFLQIQIAIKQGRIHEDVSEISWKMGLRHNAHFLQPFSETPLFPAQDVRRKGENKVSPMFSTSLCFGTVTWQWHGEQDRVRMERMEFQTADMLLKLARQSVEVTGSQSMCMLGAEWGWACSQRLLG